MPDVNFALMKMVHSTWVLQLLAFLNGRQDVKPDNLISYENCDLGKWIYSVGLSQYGHLNEMLELKTVHKSMHVVAKRVLDLKSAGNRKDAEKEFLKVDELSKRLVALITSVERKVS